MPTNLLMANETNGVTPQVSSQTIAAADASIKSSAASEETNKTLTGVHSIIIDLEELEREYYETADNYFEAAQELFGSILDSLVALQEVIVSKNEEDKTTTSYITSTARQNFIFTNLIKKQLDKKAIYEMNKKNYAKFHSVELAKNETNKCLINISVFISSLCL